MIHMIKKKCKLWDEIAKINWILSYDGLYKKVLKMINPKSKI